MSFSAPEAIIFDFEGTLVDFQWRLAEAEAEAGKVLIDLGIIPSGPASSYAEMMNRAQVLAEETGSAEGPAALSAIYDRYDADALTRWQVRPEALNTLEKIKKMGIRTGLVSNVGRVSLDAALKKVGLRTWIDEPVSRNDVRWLKPHPAGILLVGERLGCRLDQVWYVGDSLDDIRAARAAGVPIAVIQGGQDRLAEIRKANPSWIIKELSDLLALLAGETKLDF